MNEIEGITITITNGLLAEPLDVSYIGAGEAIELIYAGHHVRYTYASRDIKVFDTEGTMTDWFTASPQWERALPRTVPVV